jgi:hypothetical protein
VQVCGKFEVSSVKFEAGASEGGLLRLDTSNFQLETSELALFSQHGFLLFHSITHLNSST